jgi:hypothetical protein
MGKNLEFGGGFFPGGSAFLAGGGRLLIGPLADATPQDDRASRSATATAMPARLPIIMC